MKKNLMSLAVAAGVAGITASAQAAMYVNPEGTGQVLLFPYYNAEGTNETSMHIVNTTDAYKAVKVRFLEYVNSEEVLDFNLYLSPKDHFSFTIFANPKTDADGNPIGMGAAIVTTDNSCTVPALGESESIAIEELKGSVKTNADTGVVTRIQPFLPYQYSDDKMATTLDPNGTLRTNAGHVEIIEMGEFANSGDAKYADWAKHDEKGMPANCQKLVDAWKSTGTWGKTSPGPSDGITAAKGGLYGLSNALNRTDAAAFGIEPKAIADFWPAGKSNHSNPGFTTPSLESGDLSSLVPNAGAYASLTYTDGADAVSSLFMTDAVMNDVMLNADLNGETDWVVTFPTRRFYVKEALVANARPFTDLYVAKSPKSACETVTIAPYDREEAYTPPTVGGVNFSPLPPNPPADAKPQLCFEMNTIVADLTGDSASAESALNATIQQTATDNSPAISLTVKYAEGWQSIGFQETGQKLTAADGEVLSGLPAVGFGAYKYVNGDMSFGYVSDHKTQVACSGGTDC